MSVTAKYSPKSSIKNVKQVGRHSNPIMKLSSWGFVGNAINRIGSGRQMALKAKALANDDGIDD